MAGSEWTTDTLKAYVDGLFESKDIRDAQRFQAQQEAVAAALASQEKATATAMAAAEKAVAAAMAASEKAIAKAENAADKRADASNEIRAAMVDQQKNFADKGQTEYRLGAIESRAQDNYTGLSKRIDAIDNLMAASSGKREGVSSTFAVILSVAMAISLLVGIVGVVYGMTRSVPASAPIVYQPPTTAPSK